LPLAAKAAASAETAKAVSVPKREIRSAILIILSLFSLLKVTRKLQRLLNFK
jgi:hypothetical protein